MVGVIVRVLVTVRIQVRVSVGVGVTVRVKVTFVVRVKLGHLTVTLNTLSCPRKFCQISSQHIGPHYSDQVQTNACSQLCY